MEDIVVQHSDTLGHAVRLRDRTAAGRRRSGSTAAIKAAGKIREKARRYAAHMLEASAEDIEVEGAEYRVKGSPDKMKTIQEIAFALDLAFEPARGHGAVSRRDGVPRHPQLHVAVRDPHRDRRDRRGDRATSTSIRYVAVDDVGKKINPMIVDGQLHGGIAQGVGQALWESAIYGDDGQLLTGSMMDYAVPRASWFPNLELDETVTPSPVNPIGVKGVGEAGAIASTAAVANAVDRRAAPARHPPPRHAVHAADGVARRSRHAKGGPGMIPAAFEYTPSGVARRGASRAVGTAGPR